jgi:hypothetical protein
MMTTQADLLVNARANTSGLNKGMKDGQKAVQDFANASSVGIRKLENTFQDLGIQALGVTGPVARLGDALLEFVPGGAKGAAVIGGIGALVLIFKSFGDAAEKTKEINEKLADSIAQIKGNADQLKLDRLRNELRLLGEESESGWKKFWYGSDGRLFGFGLSFEDRRKELETEINLTADTIKRGLENAQAKLRSSAESITLARAEAGGRGEEERVRQAETALVRAQNALAVAQKEKQTQEQIANLQAEMNTAEANLITANAALRDKYAKQREDQLERERKLQETINQERIDREKYTQKVLENGLKFLEEQAKAAIERRKQFAESVAADIERTLDAAKLSLQETIDEIDRQTQKVKEKVEEQIKYIEPAIYAIASGFDVMVDAIMSGKNAFDALGRGIRAAVVQELKNLSQTFIVKGIGALADGLAETAKGNILSAGLFYKSSAKYFAAAAAAGVGSRAVAGNASGGTGAAQAFNNSQLGRSTFSTQQPLTIVVQGGLLDMSNPETQRSFTNALQTVTNRRVTMVGA